MRGYLSLKSAVCLIYVTTMFMVAMDGTIVNVALATIGREFQIPPSATGGINIGYLVSIAVFLPMAGWLGDRFGTKRVFLIALALFTASSMLCGFAESLAQLNMFRVAQGAGGGLLTPVGMAMLYRTFPPQERLQVSRSLILPIAVAPAVGPVIGGMLVEQLSWRWAFFINVPLGILTLLFGLLFLQEHKEPAFGRLDLPGVLLSVPGFSLLMYALLQGPAKGWHYPDVLGAGLCGASLVCTLIFIELRQEKPMLDFRLLSDKLFRTMSVISVFVAAGLTGMLFIFPLMYQNTFQGSALESGLIVFPEALGLIAASRLMPWPYRWLGARLVIVLGLTGTAVVCVLLSMVQPQITPWLTRALFFLMGLFLGLAVGVMQFLTFHNISPAAMGRATTLFNVQNRLGSALGVASIVNILQMASLGPGGVAQPTQIFYQWPILGTAAFFLVGIFFALTIRNVDVAGVTPKKLSGNSSTKDSSIS